jgi:hypothetical protein
MIRAIVMGGAVTAWTDLNMIRPWGIDGALIVATNHAARDYPGTVHHWVTFHPELLPRWVADREAGGRSPAENYWTGIRRLPPPGIGPIKVVENWGGSSGLLAVTVAMELQADRIICCGTPISPEMGHYDNPKPWADGGNYRRAWMRRVDHMRDRVRSCSGWTRDLIGGPTEDWWNGSSQDHRG